MYLSVVDIVSLSVCYSTVLVNKRVQYHDNDDDDDDDHCKSVAHWPIILKFGTLVHYGPRHSRTRLASQATSSCLRWQSSTNCHLF